MEWLEKNYEKAVIAIVALIAMGFGATHILSAMNLEERFVVDHPSERDDFPTLPVTKTKSSKDLLKFPFRFEDHTVEIDGGAEKKVSLLRSVWIIERDNRLFDLGNPKEEMLRPPMSNKWIIENDLDILSRSLLGDDPDGDGYSNLEEWNAEPKTKPTDSQSHPPYTDKLIFVKRQQQNFWIKLGAINDGQDGKIFQFNTRNRRNQRKSEMVTMGESIAGGRFTLLNYEEKEGKNSVGITTDRSEVTLKDEMTGKNLVAVRGDEKAWPTYFAELSFKLDRNQDQFFVKEGDPFSLEIDPTKTYRLVTVTESEAKVDIGDGKIVTLLQGALVAPSDGGQ